MENRCLAKKGVSLVTVLIFMMIATIAATATYKWLSSTGFTSADRMAMAEAKEASHAGLESVRAWMTYHANDVGAILRQYYDGQKKPVKLTDVVRGLNHGKQVFNVWLTGVEASGNTYKFTIVSNGSSRGDAKYSETSVLSVRGLYKVKEPHVAASKPPDFTQSYFGGSTGGTESVRNTSMIINGNWSGNPSRIDSFFVVTGNASLSGNDMNVGQKACVGGNLSLHNNGVTAGDIYVQGAANPFGGTINGSGVFDGSVSISAGAQLFSIARDLTLRGPFSSHQDKPTTVKGNLCIERSGKIDPPTYQGGGGFKAEKNVTATTRNALTDNLNSSGTVDRIQLGGAGYYISMPDMATCTGKDTPFQECRSGRKYQVNSLFKSSAQAIGSPTSSMACDTSIVTYCKNILGPQRNDGCDGAKYKIDDVITTAYDNFSKLVDKAPCAKIQGITGSYDMKNLNNCYNNYKNNQNFTYHSYLVVKLYGSGDNSIFKDPKGKLKGNFIFIANDKFSMLKLPPTDRNSNVFVYLEKGAGDVNTSGESGDHNYFVYSKGDINKLMNSSPEKRWDGSFYMTADHCRKIGELNTGNQYLKFNANLVKNLVDSAVICGIAELGSCGDPVGGSEIANVEGEELNTDAGYDRFYVATAPQLSITLESQRRNKEILYESLTSREYTTVAPSIIIMPRIAYLSDTPAGKLSDYFKLLNLNGAKEKYDASNTKCTPTLSKDSKLYSNNVPLVGPVYKCEYTSKTKSYGVIPFWVVVDADAATKSEVSFTTGDARIFGGGSVRVSLSVSADQNNPVSVVLKASSVPTAWDVRTLGGSVSKIGTESDGSTLYSVSLQPGSVQDIFAIDADANADNDLMVFSIVSTGDNARIGPNPSQTVWLVGSATVKRADIPQGFCDGSSKHRAINGVVCDSVLARPDCDGNLISSVAGEWVRPNCVDIATKTPNEEWGCGLANSDGVSLQARTASPYCDVFIPDSSISVLKDGQTYTFYASYKAKLFDLKVFLDGASYSDVMVRYSPQIIDANTPLSDISTKTCSVGDTCHVPIYAGSHVELSPVEKNGDVFNTWNLMRSDGTAEYTSSLPKYAISPIHDTTIVAKFNGVDHCFYTDFKDVSVWCNGSTKECIDKCTNAGKNSSCKTDGDGSYPNSDWLIPRTNNGQDYKKPEIQGEFIYYSGGKNPNSGNATITYLLNRTQAGGHGTLMSRFKACYRSLQGNSYTPLNSGFILRSNDNASKYSIVQIYGRKSQVNNVGSDVMEVRVCEGDGSGIKNENSGDCKKKTFSGITINPSEFASVMFNVEIKVVGDSADIKLSYKKDESWIRSTVRMPLIVGAVIDEYVGLGMADDCFKVMNLGWESDDWDAENCFDFPKVGCSFAANYLGGILPLNENVKPWVGTTNWFNDPLNPDKLRAGCSISYHYNGCDLASGYSTHTCEKWLDGTTHCGRCSADSEGPYYVSDIYANTLAESRGDKYKFTYAGLHGVSKDYDYNGTTINGNIREASVVIDCNGAGGNGQYYTATCGRFMVGNINECSQAASFSFDNCNKKTSCLVNVSGGIANLRSSNILGEIDGLPNDDGSGNLPVVTMVMIDANGLRSQESRINGNGTFTREVNLASDMQDFDPEKVVSLEFNSTNLFTLKSLATDCPNSVGVRGCSAEFKGDHFEVTGSILNVNGATCKVDGDATYKTDEKDCPVDGKFVVPAVDLQKTVNISGSARSYTFTITAKSKDSGEEETCTTLPVEILPSELTCNLSSTTPINAGESLPSLNYKITNCPSSGCTVEARIGSEPPQKLVYRGNGLVSSWSPDNVNTTPGNYRYSLTYAGLSCTADITVITGANGSSAENCAIDEVNKRFTADLNLVMGSTNTLKLWYIDKLGNPVSSSKSVNPSTTRFDEPLPAVSEPGDYIVVLSINGEEKCSVNYTYTGEESTPDAECYIEGDRFKTRNKNTTGQTMYGVYLNLSTDGTSNGNTVSTQNWAADGYVDMNAYLPTAPGTYTYSLGYAGNTFCSITYEVSEEEESSEP